MHHKRHKPSTSKDDKFGVKAKYQEVPPEYRSVPAKLPRGYCKKLKREHDFIFIEAKTHEWNVLQRNGKTVSYLQRFDEYRCSGCGKKRTKVYEDGKFLSSI